MRELLEDQGLPPRDADGTAARGFASLWRDKKTVVIVDIDEPPPEWKYAGEEDEP